MNNYLGTGHLFSLFKLRKSVLKKKKINKIRLDNGNSSRKREGHGKIK